MYNFDIMYLDVFACMYFFYVECIIFHVARQEHTTHAHTHYIHNKYYILCSTTSCHSITCHFNAMFAYFPFHVCVKWSINHLYKLFQCLKWREKKIQQNFFNDCFGKIAKISVINIIFVSNSSGQCYFVDVNW